MAAEFCKFTKSYGSSYGSYPSRDTLQVPTLLGVVVPRLHTIANAIQHLSNSVSRMLGTSTQMLTASTQLRL